MSHPSKSTTEISVAYAQQTLTRKQRREVARKIAKEKGFRGAEKQAVTRQLSARLLELQNGAQPRPSSPLLEPPRERQLVQRESGLVVPG